MLDGTEYFECECGADEHTLKLILDKDEAYIYAVFYLRNRAGWWRRLVPGIKYIFKGASCGSFGSWILQDADVSRLSSMLSELDDKSADSSDSSDDADIEVNQQGFLFGDGFEKGDGSEVAAGRDGSAGEY